MHPEEELSVSESQALPQVNESLIERASGLLEESVRREPWHVLYVRSNFEKRVAQHLAVRAIEHYLPLYREHVKWSDRTVAAERPLFSSYVFARFLRSERVTVISTPGVVRTLGDDDTNLVSSE